MRFDRYTLDDVILAPLWEEAEKALGKKVYYASNTVTVVDWANYGHAGHCSKLIGISPGIEEEPFWLENGDTAYCIIVAKDDDASVPGESEDDEYEEMQDECDCCGNCSGDCSCSGCLDEDASGLSELMPALNDTCRYKPFSFAADFTNAYYLESERIPEADLHNRFLVNQGIWLYCPAEGIDVCVTAITTYGVYIAASQGVQFLDWEKLFMTCRFLNGSPCGVKQVF